MYPTRISPLPAGAPTAPHGDAPFSRPVPLAGGVLPDAVPLGPSAKPFTPESLAERWGCSAEKIRQMFHSGEIAGFRLGKLIRIPAVEVEKYECAQTEAASDTRSLSTEDNLPSRSDAARIAADIRRELMTRASRG